MKDRVIALMLWCLTVPVVGFFSFGPQVSPQTKPFSSLRQCSSLVADTQHVGVARMCRRRAMSMISYTAPDEIFDSIENGDVPGALTYVRNGGDCNVEFSFGKTPLMLAVEHEMGPIISNLVLTGGANANYAIAKTGLTPLMLAAYYGHTDIARTLVEKCSAKLEMRNNKGETALYVACYWGQVDTIRYLLEAGADPFATDYSGNYPGEFSEIDPDEKYMSGEQGGLLQNVEDVIDEMLEVARENFAGRLEPGAEMGTPSLEGLPHEEDNWQQDLEEWERSGSFGDGFEL